MDNATINHLNIPSLSIITDKGRTLNVYFEPMNATLADCENCPVYAIYRAKDKNDSIFNHLSIPGEIGDNIPGLDNINQKDYLGEINFTASGQWEYDGEKLSILEQQQVAEHIQARFN
ncbi:hypothetical protein IDJ77_10450 [Mucilaginibacter sp. ZT4R22]|uniref:Lipoprotein n=1 Tax=Mucilaginibacter pankratovii TaxID=2772110 RepID=A0ABR7WPI4_9SPHI|nr:hypothetical protein [Mucilaginibacter pankratovii]MBD1364229.1 hypothetical protein [Mucilaginibacter pankratovii]